MFILIDNYDSFTYNIYHYFVELGVELQVFRNDQVTVDEVLGMNPQGIIISPGPATPDDAGICLDLIKAAYKTVPIFGVCLGHQSMGQVFGGTVKRAPYVMHGKTSPITHNGTDIFKDIPSPYTATRYHSLIVDKADFPDCLDITAESDDGLIMALKHKEYPLYGVQYHPESIASEYGHKLFENFIEIANKGMGNDG